MRKKLLLLLFASVMAIALCVGAAACNDDGTKTPETPPEKPVITLSVEGSGEVRDLAVFGVFVFVGYDVNTQILRQPDGTMLCECDEWNSIKVDLSMKTNIPGLFAAGDVRVQAPKQVVCAAGDGATAALQAIAYLEHH